jgi:DNA (cytosine-5)-methyltransferase 1
VPQSRSRLFIIGALPGDIYAEGASDFFPWAGPGLERTYCAMLFPLKLDRAHSRLSPRARRASVTWYTPLPDARETKLADFLEVEPTGISWHTEAQTRRLLALMTPAHLAKIEAIRRLKSHKLKVGSVYRRSRGAGEDKQRAEVRFDGLAGCLRTPGGGSSRQTLLFVKGEQIRSRLLSAREAARLMGLPDSYVLPSNYTEAYHRTGDGVVVPIVRNLAEHLFEPLLNAIACSEAAE